MKKNIFYSTLVSLASISLIGCGGGGNPDSHDSGQQNPQNKQPFSVSKYQSLKQDANTTAISDSDAIETAMRNDEDDIITAPGEIMCNSGTLTVAGANIDADNCTNSNVILNGKATYSMDDNEDNASLSFKTNTNITLQEHQNMLTLNQNSYVEINATTIDQNNSKILISFDLSGNLNNVPFAFDVKMDIDDYDCDTYFYECAPLLTLNVKHADIKLGNYEFVLDPMYDNTVKRTFAPIETPLSQPLRYAEYRGSIQWIEVGTNHDVQISFEEDNKTNLKIDKNGDGIFSSDEITKL